MSPQHSFRTRRRRLQSTANPHKVQRSIAILLILINDNVERGVPCLFPEKLFRSEQKNTLTRKLAVECTIYRMFYAMLCSLWAGLVGGEGYSILLINFWSISRSLCYTNQRRAITVTPSSSPTTGYLHQPPTIQVCYLCHVTMYVWPPQCPLYPLCHFIRHLAGSQRPHCYLQTS